MNRLQYIRNQARNRARNRAFREAKIAKGLRDYGSAVAIFAVCAFVLAWLLVQGL